MSFPVRGSSSGYSGSASPPDRNGGDASTAAVAPFGHAKTEGSIFDRTGRLGYTLFSCAGAG